MARDEITSRLIEFDGKVRVEAGPALKTAKATDDMLSDKKTAAHYVAGAFDAVGKQIVMGANFSYLDWLGTPVWYVYRLEEVPADQVALRQVEPGSLYWAEKGVRPTQEEAEAYAQSLL